jgi:hypothetical protein
MPKKIYKGTIESTMVGSLYTRAKDRTLFPEILKGPHAEFLLKKYMTYLISSNTVNHI